MVKWLDRYDIVDPEHINDLETHAAIKEFTDKLPRHKAEEKAYEDYKKDQMEYSAAHHLAGLRAAQGAGDMDAAKMHGTLYTTALKQLGHPEIGEVPASIQNKIKHEPSKIYRFKSHDADSFLGDSAKPKEEQSLAKSIAQIVVDKLLKGDVINFPKQGSAPDGSDKEGKVLKIKPANNASNNSAVTDYSHLLSPQQVRTGLSLTVHPGESEMGRRSSLNQTDSNGNIRPLVHYNYSLGGKDEGYYFDDEDAEANMRPIEFLPQLKAAFHTHFKP